MRLSIFFFADGVQPDVDEVYGLLREATRLADERGFYAVWLPERHFHPFGGCYPNPSVLAAGLATITTRIRLHAGSVVAPLHDPLRIAEEWAVVDNLSGGRVGLSFASGWHPRDFVLATGPPPDPDPGVAARQYRDRRERSVATMQTVRRLWRGETVCRPDGTGNLVEVGIRPRPVQPELPVWVTSSGNVTTFATAGQAGANLLTHLLGQDLGSLAEKVELYRAVRLAGAGEEAPHVTLMVHSHLGTSRSAVCDLVRAPMQAYLRSSLRLQAAALGTGGAALGTGEQDSELLVSRAFDRYFEQCGMFGTESDAHAFLTDAAAAGVDEVACLIDIGTPYQATMESLARLAAVADRC